MAKVYVVAIFDENFENNVLEKVTDTYQKAEKYLLNKGYSKYSRGKYKLINQVQGNKLAIIHEYEANKKNTIPIQGGN